MTTFIASTDGGSITGTSSNDIIIGKSGDDIINGGAGADILLGGAGNDIIYYDEYDLKVDGGSGYDILIFNGTGQKLDLGLQKTVMNFEQIDLAGGGGHTLSFSAADVLRTSDLDSLLIHGTQSSHVNFTDSGWAFLGYDSANGLSKFSNGSAIVYIDGAVNVTGFSHNATLSLGAGSVTSVTEDLNPDGMSMLVAAGTIHVSDPNAGQSLLLSTVKSQGPTHGTLTLDSIPGTAFSSGGYTYKVSNDAAQVLTHDTSWTDTFTVTSVDGSTLDMTFTTQGADDAAKIGTPPNNTVTEDTNVDAHGNLVATGKIPIEDPDAGQACFDLNGFNGTGQWGTLTLGKDPVSGLADGSYTYTVNNASINSWNNSTQGIDKFTVKTVDGTSSEISFTVNGKNDAPSVFQFVQNFPIAEAKATLNADGTVPNNFYIAKDTLIVSDVDNDISGSDLSSLYTVKIEALDNAIGNPSTQTEYFGPSIPFQVTWKVYFDEDMLNSLKTGDNPTYSYRISITDPNGGTATKDVSVTITGADDPIMGTDTTADTLTGTADDDWMSGLGGNDTINGLAGVDHIYGGTGDDLLNGGAGNDEIFGGDGKDTIDGGTGKNILNGDDGDDTFNIGESEGTIHGGAGIDSFNFGPSWGQTAGLSLNVYGDAGKDEYNFDIDSNEAKSFGIHIADFNPTEDSILITRAPNVPLESFGARQSLSDPNTVIITYDSSVAIADICSLTFVGASPGTVDSNWLASMHDSIMFL